MKYMRCNTCRKVVIYNAIGMCLSCQRGFTREKQEDEVVTLAKTIEKVREFNQRPLEVVPIPISKRKRTKEEEND